MGPDPTIPYQPCQSFDRRRCTQHPLIELDLHFDGRGSSREQEADDVEPGCERDAPSQVIAPGPHGTVQGALRTMFSSPGWKRGCLQVQLRASVLPRTETPSL